VVLAVSEAAEFCILQGSGGGFLQVFIMQGRREFIAGEMREVIDPGFEDDFFGTAGLDAFAAGVRDTGGRFAEK